MTESRRGYISEFKIAIRGITPFMEFWSAQNALFAMYGLEELNYDEAMNMWWNSFPEVKFL